MKKLKDKSNIDKALILHWKTKQIEDLLGLPDVEDELLSSYENGLFETPVSSPKISPREMIYALSSQGASNYRRDNEGPVFLEFVH